MSRLLTFLAVVLLVGVPVAGTAADTQGVYLEVSPEGRDDLDELLDTLEQSLEKGLPKEDPVVVILHGEEALSFTRAAYPSNRAMIDRAALLDAYELIDVRMCESWMRAHGIERGDIPAFIETVPLAPEEIERLEGEGYKPYDSVKL